MLAARIIIEWRSSMYVHVVIRCAYRNNLYIGKIEYGNSCTKWHRQQINVAELGSGY